MFGIVRAARKSWRVRRRCCDKAFAASHRSASGPTQSRFPTKSQETDKLGQRVDRLPLADATKHNLFGMGITKLFDIQAKALHPILRGQSFVGRSRTGTGKTIAYLLPVLERVRHEKITAPHAVLVLAPTRELCQQVGSTILTLCVTANIALVYGGPSLASQEQLVRLGANIVISTPGRCARLLERGAINPQNVRVLVIDEVDAMLGLEFLGRVEKVLAAVSKEGLQSILFSASLPIDVQNVIQRHFSDYEFVDLVDRAGLRRAATVESVEHCLCKVSRSRALRTRTLLYFLPKKLDELGGRCIIFVDSTAEAKALLTNPVLDRKACTLHGESSPQERDSVLTSFANGEFDVLIATDLVSRGVDFKDVTLVLQFHPPQDATQYVHRAGRTGRAGRHGVCITFFDASETALVQRVREVTKQNFRTESTPAEQDIHHSSVSRLLDELLMVQPEQYNPILGDAKKLLGESGSQALAVAMAVLDGRHADLQRAAREAPSLLSGLNGFVCLLAHDPDHTAVSSEGEVRRVLHSLLPRQASDAAVGRVVRTSEGWAIDVSHRWATPLTHSLQLGRQTAPFEITVARRLPRLLRSSATRSRRMPWASMRKLAMRTGVRGRRGQPRLDGRWPG